ncbi:MAG: hypothetical protein ACLQVA_02695 [Candidatus Brocadiia bacterium]
MIAVFCCASETTCAWTSLSVEAVVESGATVCVAFCAGADEQPAMFATTHTTNTTSGVVQVRAAYCARHRLSSIVISSLKKS